MITNINHINFSVRNIDKSFIFYRDVLGFKPMCKWPSGAYFLVGDFWFCINLIEQRIPEPSADYTHFAFSVAQTDFNAMKQSLINAGVKQFKDDISEGDSFYFLDPDGYKMEIHVGDWRSRIESKKCNPWPGVEFFI